MWWLLGAFALIAWVSLWMAIGVRYARSQSAALYKRAEKNWNIQRFAEDEWRGALRMRAFFWPCYIFMSTMTQPVYDQRKRVKELQAENKELVMSLDPLTADPTEVRIMNSLCQRNRELIKQLEI